MNDTQEKWAIFWCDLLKPIIFSDIEPEGEHAYLRRVADDEVRFPNGRMGNPSLSTLKRKLKRYRQGGFHGLKRQSRNDRGISRKVDAEIMQTAIDLKKEQPYRSDRVLNQFLKERYGVTLPRTTLYRHLKQAGATKVKMGVSCKKVRKRWSKKHTHDLWVGDFEEGPYIFHENEVLPTHLSGFIDCHSRYVVEARYYLRQNMDVLIDAMIRALAAHGAPLGIYLDNAKVYHSQGLRSACYRIGARLIHRPAGDPAPGGIIERFFGTVQSQFEAEVRAGDILTLEQLNRAFSAWLAVGYHDQVHSETAQEPADRYRTGLTITRHVDMNEVIDAFKQRAKRTVNPVFSDIRLNNQFFKVDPRLRGDRVEVRIDPFSSLDTVEVYSLADSRYLGRGTLHHRENAPNTPQAAPGKPQNSYIDLLVRQHDRQLAQQSRGIDYKKAVDSRPWPFHEFIHAFSRISGRKGGLSAFSANELEMLKKFYNQSPWLNKQVLKTAIETACDPSVPGIIRELKQLKKEVF
jgi:putative transposase